MDDEEAACVMLVLSGADRCDNECGHSCNHYARIQPRDKFPRRCMCCANKFGYNEMFPSNTTCYGFPL